MKLKTLNDIFERKSFANNVIKETIKEEAIKWVKIKRLQYNPIEWLAKFIEFMEFHNITEEDLEKQKR